jgi:excisionase family DNA binding protein
VQDLILTSSEAARLLGCTVGTVLVWAKRGILPTTRTATGLHLFMRDDVIRLVVERSKQRGK